MIQVVIILVILLGAGGFGGYTWIQKLQADNKVLEVNHAFRAVKIEKPGLHRIAFEYRPRLWRMSLLLGFFGVIILIGIVLVNLRQTNHMTHNS